MSLRHVRFRVPHAIVPAVVALAAYVYCLPPGVGWWDTGEAQTVPYVAGIFHPTGFPVYAMAGWLFTHVVAIGNVAWRTSLLSAVATAASALLLVRCATKLGAGPKHASAAALLFALTPVVFEHATRAGVNAFALLLIAVAFDRALAGRPIAAAFFGALAVGAHTASVWMLPGILVVAAAHRWPTRGSSARTASAAAGAFALGLCSYGYLPLRSAAIASAGLDPTRDLPVPNHAIWNYDDPSTLDGFARIVSGSDYKEVSTTFATLLAPANYAAYAVAFGQALVAQYSYAGVALALAGLIALRRRPWIALGLVTTAFGVFPFSIHFSTLIGQTDPPKYHLVALWAAGVAIALGASDVSRLIAVRVRALAGAGIVVLLVLAAFAGVESRRFVGQRDDRSADGIVASVRNDTPDGAIVVTQWWYATPLFYAAYADASLGRRRIVSTGDHAVLAALARRGPTYYFPLPADDVRIDGALLKPVPGAWPALYRVTPAPVAPR